MPTAGVTPTRRATAEHAECAEQCLEESFFVDVSVISVPLWLVLP